MFEKEIFVERRRRLCDQLSTGLILLPGNTESPVNYAGNAYPFRQDSHFLYFAGIDEPDLFVVVDIDTRETTLFADELTMDDIIWTGPRSVIQRLRNALALPRCFLFLLWKVWLNKRCTNTAPSIICLLTGVKMPYACLHWSKFIPMD